MLWQGNIAFWLKVIKLNKQQNKSICVFSREKWIGMFYVWHGELTFVITTKIQIKLTNLIPTRQHLKLFSTSLPIPAKKQWAQKHLFPRDICCIRGMRGALPNKRQLKAHCMWRPKGPLLVLRTHQQGLLPTPRSCSGWRFLVQLKRSNLGEGKASLCKVITQEFIILTFYLKENCMWV